MNLWMIAALSLSLSLPLITNTGQVSATPEASRTIVFLGDSLTAGLGLPLDQAFVINGRDRERDRAAIIQRFMA